MNIEELASVLAELDSLTGNRADSTGGPTKRMLRSSLISFLYLLRAI